MDKKPSKLLKFFAFIGVIAVIGGIAYAIYKYLTPEYLEDEEDDDDFDDDFEDYFEDEDDDFDNDDDDDAAEGTVADTEEDEPEDAGKLSAGVDDGE